MKNRFQKFYAPFFTLLLTGLLALAGCGGVGGGTNAGGGTTTTITGQVVDGNAEAAAKELQSALGSSVQVRVVSR